MEAFWVQCLNSYSILASTDSSIQPPLSQWSCWITSVPVTVYPKKYAHGFVVLCFVVVMQSFIMNLHEVFIHIHQGCFAGTGAIVRLPQCQWSKSDGYGKISQCITTTKHSKAKTVCIFLGIYCMVLWLYLKQSESVAKQTGYPGLVPLKGILYVSWHWSHDIRFPSQKGILVTFCAKYQGINLMTMDRWHSTKS